MRQSRCYHCQKKNSREEFSNLYPDETRPGLVYGKLNTFYNVMRVGDWIIIPSKSTQDLTIGILGDILHEEIKERKVVPDNKKAVRDEN